MKASLAALVAIVLGIGSRADAQPALTPPSAVPPSPAPAAVTAPPPAQVRRGLLLGADMGIGGMRSNAGTVDCVDCQADPPAAGMRLEIGAMLTPHFGLAAAFDLALKPVMQSSQTDVVQSAMVLDAMYWASRRMWLSAGVAADKLESVCNGCSAQKLDSAVGFDGGLGYELVSSRRFALDARFRLALAHYAAIADTVATSTFAIGIRWFATR